mgnify:CR=1 FL=1
MRGAPLRIESDDVAAVVRAHHAVDGAFHDHATFKAWMRVVREEIFGPVAPVVKFQTEEQAVELANATPFGLAAYFYSRDVGRCWRVAEAIEAGHIAQNAITSGKSQLRDLIRPSSGRRRARWGAILQIAVRR